MSSSYLAADSQPRRVPAQHPPPSASHNMRRAGEIYKTPYYQTPPPASPTAKPRPRPESPSVLEVKIKDGEAVGGGGAGGGGSVLTESSETRRRQQLLQNLKDKRQQERQELQVLCDLMHVQTDALGSCTCHALKHIPGRCGLGGAERAGSEAEAGLGGLPGRESVRVKLQGSAGSSCPLRNLCSNLCILILVCTRCG